MRAHGPSRFNNHSLLLWLLFTSSSVATVADRMKQNSSHRKKMDRNERSVAYTDRGWK